MIITIYNSMWKPDDYQVIDYTSNFNVIATD